MRIQNRKETLRPWRSRGHSRWHTVSVALRPSRHTPNHSVCWSQEESSVLAEWPLLSISRELRIEEKARQYRSPSALSKWVILSRQGRPKMLQYYSVTLIPSSFNCEPSTSPGESIIRSCADAVFGNAMTSRMFSVPQRIMHVRSMPAANPPCGGVPYSRASRKNPNCERADSGVMPKALKFNAGTSF